MGRRGARDVTADFREDSRVGQSVRAQLGDRVGARTSAASNLRRIGRWSEPVEGSGSN